MKKDCIHGHCQNLSEASSLFLKNTRWLLVGANVVHLFGTDLIGVMNIQGYSERMLKSTSLFFRLRSILGAQLGGNTLPWGTMNTYMESTKNSFFSVKWLLLPSLHVWSFWAAIWQWISSWNLSELSNPMLLYYLYFLNFQASVTFCHLIELQG